MILIFRYKAKLIKNTVVQPTLNADYGIVENATIAVPLKYLSDLGDRSKCH